MRGRKNIRLPNYDYRSDGWYFVTIITKGRQRFFLDQSKLHHCEIIFRETAKMISGVEIDTMVVMPDHIHLILFLEACTVSIGEIIRRMKARTSREYGQQLWQANYYEHIIRDEKSLAEIQEYIVLNPDSEPSFNRNISR